MIKRYLSLFDRTIDLVIDDCIIETGVGGLMPGAGIDHTPGAGPVDGPETHRAGLAGSIEVTVCKLIGIKLPAGVPDSHDLGMRRRIIGRCYLVIALADDHTVFHDHAAERPP